MTTRERLAEHAAELVPDLADEIRALNGVPS